MMPSKCWKVNNVCVKRIQLDIVIPQNATMTGDLLSGWNL